MAKPKFKIKHTITRKEWNKTHKDFKSIIDGVPYTMMYNDKTGTHLVPVKIIDESINEADVKKKINRRGDEDGLLVQHNGKEYHIVYSGDFGISSTVMPYGIVMPGDDTVSFLSKDRNAKTIWKQLKPKVDKFLKSNESVNEAERGDIGYVEKHKSIATIYDVMNGGKKVRVKLGKTGKLVVIDTNDIKILPESIHEMDINDPILMKLRALQMKKNKEAAKKIDTEKQNRNAIKIKALKKKRAEVMRDMEQEAEPEGGKIADRYGKLLNRIDNDIIKFGGNPMSESVNEVNYTDQTGMKSSVLKNNKVSSLIDFKLWRWAIDNSVKLYKGIGQNYMFTDGIMSLGVNLNKPATIVKKWGKVDNKLKQIHLKNINENDGVYFKSYTAAIEAARAAALKKGFEVEEDEMFTKVGMNSKRPSVGKTTKVSLELIKNGKPQRKMLHIQVYGMKNGYELNSYIN